MDSIAQLFDASRAGSPANEASFPSPERGAPNMNAVISQQQLVLNREIDGDILEGTMALSYNIVQLNYTVTAILQTHEDKAAVAVQLICQVDSQGVPVTPQRIEHVAKLSIREKQKFIDDAREPRQWCLVDPVELTSAPTYNFLTGKIREALPLLYDRMIAHRAGDPPPFEAMRRALAQEEATA